MSVRLEALVRSKGEVKRAILRRFISIWEKGNRRNTVCTFGDLIRSGRVEGRRRANFAMSLPLGASVGN